MATKYLESVAVPLLRQKLQWLYHHTDIRGHDDLARRLPSKGRSTGLTAKAVKNWLHSDGARLRNHVPAARFDQLVTIFKDRMSGSRTDLEVRALLLSPTDADIAFALTKRVTSQDWMTRAINAPASDATLVECSAPGALEVTTRGKIFESRDGELEYPVGKWFRIKLGARWDGWLTLLQWDAHGWYGLEIDDRKVSLPSEEFTGILPVQEPFFRESGCGSKRFFFVYTQVPLPPDLLHYLISSAKAPAALDIVSLDRLAYHAGTSEGFRMTQLPVTFV